MRLQAALLALYAAGCTLVTAQDNCVDCASQVDFMKSTCISTCNQTYGDVESAAICHDGCNEVDYCATPSKVRRSSRIDRRKYEDEHEISTNLDEVQALQNRQTMTLYQECIIGCERLKRSVPNCPPATIGGLTLAA